MTENDGKGPAVGAKKSRHSLLYLNRSTRRYTPRQFILWKQTKNNESWSRQDKTAPYHVKSTIPISVTHYEKDEAPRYAKVDMYYYKMAAPLSTILWRWAVGQGQIWWTRQFEESLVVPVTFDKSSGGLIRADLPSLS
jgi:hypothetical protein